MKQLYTFVKKEFYHVFRDRKTLLMLFGVPIAQIILFGFALTNEIKGSKIIVVDYAKDVASQQLITRIGASKYFEVEKSFADHNQIEDAFKQGKIKLAVIIPQNFNDDILHFNKAQVQVIADASDPNTATTLTNYITNIVSDYQSSLTPNQKIPYRIVPQIRMLYNPELKGAPNFVPGVMALVLMLVCTMMTSIAIVREKEMGTMEVLLVSPFKPVFVIISKAIPYLLLSIINLIIILLLSVFVLNLPIKGNIFLLFGASTLFILTSLSIGLIISTVTTSQQSAMMASLMGMMLPTMLLTGFMFPVENMPVPLQVLSNIVPSRWYYIIIKNVMIKGLGFSAIWKETLILTGMTLLLLGLSLRNFKNRLA
ncbi:MAG TPA: ABC transporter permease [Chitinophagaceae bacterium]|nr:ABC transporter permease [Chitinophagaceae bacterium]